MNVEQDRTRTIVAAANAFLETLTDTERERVLFPWTDTAQKQRWSNFPTGAFHRAGLMWGDMREPQRNAWLQLMQTTMSDEGYERVIAAWNADDVVAAQDLPTPNGAPPAFFGKDYFYIALIGTPSETDPWQWQWGGHHVTVNATVARPNIALTPSFIGCQPCKYTDTEGNTVRPLGDIEDDAFALVNTLDERQQSAAVLGDTPIDLVLGPGQEGVTIQSEGLPASEMTAEQQVALLQLIGHYTGLVNDATAATRQAEVESTLDETYFAWYGPMTAGSAAYFRVTGPTLVVEYAPQANGPQSTVVDPLYVHGMYRDPTNDYGARYTR